MPANRVHQDDLERGTRQRLTTVEKAELVELGRQLRAAELDSRVAQFAPKVGVAKACRALA